MQIIDVVQGSHGWLAIRAKHFCASDAPAMLGLSKFMSRSGLLRQKATGAEREVDAGTQARFDRGHAAEAAARPAVEAYLQEDLFPCTAALEVDGLPLLASLDGVTMDESVLWENKLTNASLVADLQAGIVVDAYWPQIEHQLLVAGARRAYFTAADTDGAITGAIWYESVPERRARIIAGWKRFAEDLTNYQHQEVIPAAVAAPQETLPAVSVQVTGSIAVIDNLTVFGDALMAYVERINKSPKTDEDFATLEATVKALKKAEDALDAAEANALGQTASLDTLRRTVGQYRDLARASRLTVEKLVKAEKENRRNAIMQAGINALREHIDTLNKRLGKSYMPDTQWASFPVAMKGLKTMASLQNAADTELAQAKINSSACADRIEISLASLRELASDHAFLFADAAQLVLKDNDALVAIVKQRIAEHQAAEAKRLEAEREKIRIEETAKAQAAITLPPPANRSTEPAIQPAAQAVQAPSGGQPQEPAVIAATITTGHLHDLIDDATKDMTTDELLAVLSFATTVRIERNQPVMRSRAA